MLILASLKRLLPRQVLAHFITKEVRGDLKNEVKCVLWDEGYYQLKRN